MNKSDRTHTSTRRVLLALGIIALLAIMLSGAAYAGYLLGRTDAIEVTESVNRAPGAVTATPIKTAEPPAVEPDLATQAQIAQESVLQDSPAVPATAVPATAVPATAVPATAVPATAVSATEPAAEPDVEEQSQLAPLDLTAFHEVWELVGREYDGDLPEDKERLYAAISGSLQALGDEYTRFVRPEIAERLRDDMDGSVSGIGAIVRPHVDGLVEIVRPIDSQPADLAGLKPGDLIVAVDGESLAGMNFDEVLLRVRGPEGTTVLLTIMREGEDNPLEFSLMRAEFEVPIVESNLIETDSSSLAYVKLNSFTRTAEDEVAEALKPLLAQKPVGIILDLRDNGGGYLDQAVSVADLFLPEAVILYERGRNGLDETFRSDNGDIGEGLPLVLLVNEGSASASEIVAGAIKDNGRGVLVGADTFGKGSVQHVHTLADGSELRVTVARWFTPNNQSISDNGIAPDVEVATPEELGGPGDTQLQRAVDYLVNGE